nr:hypothetical protein [Candidatus Hamiltonella defensa]
MNQPTVDVVDWRLDNLVTLIKGPEGIKVRLEILSVDKNKKSKIVTLTRAFIKFKDRAVKISMKSTGKGLNEEKIGILKIPCFYIGLTEDVKNNYNKRIISISALLLLIYEATVGCINRIYVFIGFIYFW